MSNQSIATNVSTSANNSFQNFHVVYDVEQVHRIMELIREDLSIENRYSFLRSYNRCFVAREFVYQVQIKLGWTKQQASFFGQLLNQKDIIHNVANLKPFEDDDEWWRFQCHEETFTLNWKQIVTIQCQVNSVSIVKHLYEELLSLVHSQLASLSEMQSSTNVISCLKGVSALQQFRDWEYKVCMLQKITLNFDFLESLSFWLNTYNMLCLHSILHFANENVDPISSYSTRRTFFNIHNYLINGHQYTLDDIEHGILRCNNDYFKEKDSRLAFRVSKSDARIFSVLTCYNKSSPLPLVIPEKEINEALNFAEQNFFRHHMHINGNTIFMPKLCTWYSKEYQFTDTKSIVNFLIEVLTLGLPATTKQIETLSRIDFSLCNIKYIEYDWQLNLDSSSFGNCSIPCLVNSEHESIDT